jgi:hypothetical protein
LIMRHRPHAVMVRNLKEMSTPRHYMQGSWPTGMQSGGRSIRLGTQDTTRKSVNEVLATGDVLLCLRRTGIDEL